MAKKNAALIRSGIPNHIQSVPVPVFPEEESPNRVSKERPPIARNNPKNTPADGFLRKATKDASGVRSG